MALLLSFSTSAVADDLNRLLSVKGMTCPACSVKVERALTGVSGVRITWIRLSVHARARPYPPRGSEK
jgi:hypothetical protein